MSDVATAKPVKPLICIGIGTANISPLLASSDFNPENLREAETSGLQIKVGEEDRTAFNDVVVGSTILSTINGKSVQVDAREFMKGKKVVSMPRKFRARVEVGERVVEGIFGNIFVTLTDKRFLGRVSLEEHHFWPLLDLRLL